MSSLPFFSDFFCGLWGLSLPWQRLLAKRLVEGERPRRALDLPTPADNTEFLDIIVYVLTLQEDMQSPLRSARRKHPELRRSLRPRTARDRRSRSGLWI